MPSAIDNFNALHYDERLELLSDYGIHVTSFQDGVNHVEIWLLITEYVRVYINPRVNANKPTLITMLTYKQLTDVVNKLNITLNIRFNGRRNKEDY